MKEYTILAAVTQESLEKFGADVEVKYIPTLKDAKQRAMYATSEAYRIISEASTRLGYSQVVDDKGTIVFDHFASF